MLPVTELCLGSENDIFRHIHRLNSIMFTFAICHRPSVSRLSVTFVRSTQAIEIFGNVLRHFVR